MFNNLPREPFNGFKFGCDPELFVFDPSGKPVPAGRFFPGTKAAPHKVEFGAVQVDGFAAEFNIDPATDFNEFNRNISAVIKQMSSFIPSGYTLEAVPFVRFDKETFDSASEDEKELGCQPDFNAWEMSVNPPPDTEHDPYMRCAAGHVHIGWTEDADILDKQHILNCCDLVKQLDWHLGGWSVLMDSDPTRRTLYGRAGACRLKPYGVEYRVLSNFWVTNRHRRLAMWNRLQAAIFDMRSNYIPEKLGDSANSELINYINKSERETDFESKFYYPVRSSEKTRKFANLSSSSF